MNILIWDQCGQDELQLYVVPDEHIELLARCHGKYVNSVSAIDEDDMGNLDRLSELVDKLSPVDTSGPFALDASTFFISGFVP